MPMENNVNIKLEVFKDKFTGKISIVAHFIHSAPNVYKEQEDYVWFPTNEEKNFLIEAFDLTSPNYSKNIQPRKDVSQVSNQNIEPNVVPQTPVGIEPNLNIQDKDTQYTNKDTVYPDGKTTNTAQNYEDVKQTTEVNNQPTIEEPKKEEQQTNNYFQNNQKTEKEPVVNDYPKEFNPYDNKKKLEAPDPNYNQNTEEEKRDPYYKKTEDDNNNVDNAIIAQADFDAIDAAVKKHTDKEDYLVQADEKTIVDKVLNQKKKGKWSRHH
jgi:hypothetical protein